MCPAFLYADHLDRYVIYFILSDDFGTVNFLAFCSDYQDPSAVCWKAILIMDFNAHNLLRFNFCVIHFFAIDLYQLSTKNLSEYLLIGRAWGCSIILR